MCIGFLAHMRVEKNRFSTNLMTFFKKYYPRTRGTVGLQNYNTLCAERTRYITSILMFARPILTPPPPTRLPGLLVFITRSPAIVWLHRTL